MTTLSTLKKQNSPKEEKQPENSNQIEEKIEESSSSSCVIVMVIPAPYQIDQESELPDLTESEIDATFDEEEWTPETKKTRDMAKEKSVERIPKNHGSKKEKSEGMALKRTKKTELKRQKARRKEGKKKDEITNKVFNVISEYFDLD